MGPLAALGPIASRPVVSKQELNKRRVSAERADRRRETVVVTKDRRKRLIVGSMIGFLAFALIAPLAAGLLVSNSDPGPTSEPIETLPVTTTPPSLIEPAFAGAALTGETPCPATDGSQERTTQFETAPPVCIDPAAAYDATLTLGDDLGAITISIDPGAAPAAANMFVTLANYGAYDTALVTPLFPGLTIIGGDGDAGFTIGATEPPADGIYPVGSVVMFTSIDGSLEGQIVLITSEEAAELLAENPVHPIVGEIVGELDPAIALHEAALEDLTVGVRVAGLSVNETP